MELYSSLIHLWNSLSLKNQKEANIVKKTSSTKFHKIVWSVYNLMDSDVGSLLLRIK